MSLFSVLLYLDGDDDRYLLTDILMVMKKKERKKRGEEKLGGGRTKSWSGKHKSQLNRIQEWMKNDKVL